MYLTIESYTHIDRAGNNLLHSQQEKNPPLRLLTVEFIYGLVTERFQLEDLIWTIFVFEQFLKDFLCSRETKTLPRFFQHVQGK
jgi:hypothetical protein